MNINLYSRDEAAEWDASLAGITHDIYQTSGYHIFESANGEGEPFAFVADDGGERLVWPYLRKPVCLPGDDEEIAGSAEVRSCYGYPGPVCTPDPSSGFLAEASQGLLALWRDEGVVNAFTRLHPVLQNHRLVEAMPAFQTRSETVRHGKTVSIDLRLDGKTRFSKYAASFRNGIRRNQRAGYQTILDTSLRYLDVFYRFYQAAMDKNNASSYYYFSRDYFERLISHQRGTVHLFVTLTGDTPACTALYSAHQKQMQSLFMMNNPDLLKMAPSRTLIEDVAAWGQANGFVDLHLGGGRGGAEDSLFDFKASFSDLHRSFYTHRLVVDEREYRDLVAARESLEPLSLNEPYFPAWRKPLSLVAASQ